ncbi:glycoside hydrolase family 28 protein [Portibacter marinus]|uniref:glycoside hydrolase family 28 protein n=1 Tax=Portibacter marinus TaxID=2898660 RepID=UPI001F20912F|nr:glycosyl hydrolase family 28 protein [Portibacter marinus]
MNIIIHRILVILAVCLSAAVLKGREINILDYGALPDGKSLNTTAIQRAIDTASVSENGIVYIPNGTFLTGTLYLKSNVELKLHQEAVLLGSTDIDQYYKINRWKALIIAQGERNIKITGKGTINGQGRTLAVNIDNLFYEGKIDSADYNFVEMRPKYYLRPQILELVACEDVVIKGITFKDAACWVQTYDKCRNVMIDSITVDSDAYWNNDGVDIQDCINVILSNSFINSADDGICLKSQSSDHYCDSITIENCVVRSSASAVKFGTVSHGGFRNIKINNIKIYDTFRSAIAIECVDGAVLENILIENISAENTGNALFIRLGERSKKEKMGVLRNLTIRNVEVKVAFERPDYPYDIRGPALPFFHNTFPASIVGIPGYPVENIQLENINIYHPGRGNAGLANAPLERLKQIPEEIDEYPEFSMFGELPAWGLYCRHVMGLSLNQVHFHLKEKDYRPAMVLDDVHNSSFVKVKMHGPIQEVPIILHNSSNNRFTDSSPSDHIKN